MSPPIANSFRSLPDLFEAAVDSVSEAEWQDHCPVYPEAIPEFMDFILYSPWGDTEYEPDAAEAILNDPTAADLNEVRCALTAIARSERFFDGSWFEALRNVTREAVVTRARELTMQRDGIPLKDEIDDSNPNREEC